MSSLVVNNFVVNTLEVKVLFVYVLVISVIQITVLSPDLVLVRSLVMTSKRSLEVVADTCGSNHHFRVVALSINAMSHARVVLLVVVSVATLGVQRDVISELVAAKHLAIVCGSGGDVSLGRGGMDWLGVMRSWSTMVSGLVAGTVQDFGSVRVRMVSIWQIWAYRTDWHVICIIPVGLLAVVHRLSIGCIRIILAVRHLVVFTFDDALVLCLQNIVVLILLFDLLARGGLVLVGWLSLYWDDNRG